MAGELGDKAIAALNTMYEELKSKYDETVSELINVKTQYAELEKNYAVADQNVKTLETRNKIYEQLIPTLATTKENKETPDITNDPIDEGITFE